MYRCMYIWVFSRSDGAGSATTRNTRGLTALGDGADGPALAGAVASFEDDDHAQPLGLHPGLQRAQLGLQAAQFLS